MRTTWIVLANLVLPLVLRAQYGPPEVIRGNLPQINSVSESKFFDIDLDGHLDMVCASTDSVFWFKGDGADHYGPGRIALSGLAFARSLDYGDVNGDGVDDLVVAQGSNGGIVRGLNNGFGEFEFVAPEIPNIGGVIFVQLADLNGDGHNDIVWLGQGRISSFMNDGLGNFGEPQVITGTTVLTNEFTLGDVDQDGDIDVIFNREAVTWYANDGTGQFSAVEALGVWGIGTHVELVDLNGDTRPDVVFTTAFGDLVYRPATGGGSFDPELILEDGIGTGNVRAADLDADGDQDLVLAAADSVWVLLNDGTANFTRSSNGLASVVNIFLQDLTGDGAKDLVYNPWNSTDMAYLANIGGGEFRSRPVKVPYREGVGTIRPVDIDADGDMDLITRGDLMVSLFTQQPDGFFVDSAMYFGEEPMGNFDLQDIDQDGALDLLFYTGVEYAATLYWKRNLGNGQFGPEVLLATDHNGRFTQLDVDGDGDLDHVVGYPDLGWRRNDGTSFSGHITIDAAATIVYTTESADLNGDGLQDILLLHENSNISWYRNLGNGLFAPRVGLGAFAFGPEVHPADLDQDGDLDLVIAFASVDVAVLMNDGNGVFGPAEMLVVQLALNGTILVVDVDGDGDLDILNGRRMAFNYLPNDGTGQFGEEIVLFPDDQFVEIYGLVPADVDRNGLLDFVYVRSNGYQFEWMPNRSDAYHRIEGRMFFDADADGVRDPGEPPIPWSQVTTSPAPQFPFSGNNGAFLALVDPGTYLVEPVFDADLWYITTDSANYTVTVNAQGPVSAGNDFGLFVNAPRSEVALELVVPQGLCTQIVPHWVSVSNLGNLVESGILALDHDPSYTMLSVNPAPDSIVANTYYWSYAGLWSGASRSIQMTSQMPEAEQAGDTVHFALRAYTYGSGTPGVITDTITVNVDPVVACSYDPNDKQVYPQGYGDFHALELGTEHLDFTIRFQNTGNAPAFTVTLRDTLPPEVDPQRLSILGYSFTPTDVRVDDGNVLTVSLQGIMLPDSASDPLGSNGFVAFRAGLVQDLPHGAEITNTAGIYFDLNEPIITNTTLTTLVDCALWQPQIAAIGTNGLGAPPGDAYQWSFNGVPLVGATQQQLAIASDGLYEVRVTSLYGCVATAALQVTEVGMAEQADLNFGVVPNPMGEDAVLWSKAPLGADHRVELIDAKGRVVRSLRGNGRTRLTLARQGLVPGLYTILINNPEGVSNMVRLAVH